MKLASLSVIALALAVPQVAHAQFSDGFTFLKGVRDADGGKVTALLNKPGSVIVDTRDASSGETALHIVVKRRDAAWLGFLLQKGAKPDLKDDDGNTPLLLATQLRWVEGIETLIARRASIDAANASGETALIRAVQNRDIASARLLLAAGANPNRPDNAAGLSARDYARRDPRSAAIAKVIDDAKPVKPTVIAGPR